LRVVVLRAWKELQRIRREQVQLQELPVAQLAALLANVNRDPKKGKPFSLNDFTLFAEERKEDGVLSPEVAAVALELRHEDKAPPLLITCWPQVLASVKDGTKVPTQRALRSDDDAVWVLAPSWEGSNVRGGLVLVRGRISGTVVLRDLDKPLLSFRFKLPERPGFGWMEAGCLLVAQEI
jgi:hypothetical protein